MSRQNAFQELGYDLAGWTQIADYLDTCDRTARTLAKRGEDPLPVSRFNGRIIAKKAELAQWVSRELAPPKDAP